jgi:hypothetical protein
MVAILCRFAVFPRFLPYRREILAATCRKKAATGVAKTSGFASLLLAVISSRSEGGRFRIESDLASPVSASFH